MNQDFLFYALIGVIVAATLGYLNKKASTHTQPKQDGWYLLRMHRLYNFMGYLGILLGIVVGIGPVLTDEADLAMYITIFLAFLIFMGLGILSVLFYRNHYLRFNDTDIEVSNAYGKITRTSWDNLIDGRFNISSGLITLTDSDGTKLKIHQHLIGLGGFVGLMEQKTKIKAKDIGLPVKAKNLS